MQVLASQLPFLANRNAEQAVPPLFWPVNCIKIGRHVALLSGPSVYVYSVVLVAILNISGGRGGEHSIFVMGAFFQPVPKQKHFLPVLVAIFNISRGDASV